MIDPDDMPLCPFCYQPILSWEESIIVRDHVCQFLSHSSCFNAEELPSTNTDKEQG